MSQSRPDQFSYRVTDLVSIVRLRHAELRQGLPIEAADFPGDDQPATFHFGIFLNDSETLGCASFMLNSDSGRPAYQLRGMATRHDWVGRGLGRNLLLYAEQMLREQTDVRRLWCNARAPAVGFYEKQGWAVVSDLFDIPTAGPHYKMAKRL